MHQVAPFLLTGLGGAAVPTVGVTVLVGRNSSLFQEKTELEKQRESLQDEHYELYGKVNRPSDNDMVDIADQHYWPNIKNGKYIRYEDLKSTDKLEESKCWYKLKTYGSGERGLRIHYHVCGVTER